MAEMKKTDLKLIAEFLDKQHQAFAEFLEEDKEIGGVEGDMIIEELMQTIDAMEDRTCRECGCTDDDCGGCIEKTGQPCCWVGIDLCSACQGGVVSI